MTLTDPSPRTTTTPWPARVADSRRLPPRADLPVPPGPDEKYLYLGPQARRFMAVQGFASVVTATVLLSFFARHLAVAMFVPALLLHLTYVSVSLATTTMRRRVDRAGHEARVAGWAPAQVPVVDVFLPSCGEPLEILRNTYRHVAALDWPGELRVTVLDDSGRDAVRRLAGAAGFAYLSRPDRGRLKKAGNLAFGFAHTDGDLVAILDADFCPAPEFLRELVPYFDEPDVGIVQSPQYFDSRRPTSWLQRAAGSVQEIFYRWVQPSRDAADGAICVGTCAVYRRAALAAAGGFAQIGHSEDVHTGVKLLRSGYRLRYVPVLVARGLCPDTVEGFLSQQYRWCAGSMSLLVDRGFHNAGLTLRQRLCFWTGFLYYLTTAVTLFTGPAAAAALLWLLAERVSPRTYLPLVALTWLTFWMWNRITCARWDLAVVRVQLLYSAAHALAIWHTVRGHTADWVPSGAAARGVPLATTVRRLLAGWLSLFLVVVWAGVTRAVLTHGWGRFWLSCCLAALATVVTAPVVTLCARPQLPPRVAHPGRARARHARPTSADQSTDRHQAGRRPAGNEAPPPPPSDAVPDPLAVPAGRRRRGMPDRVTWPEVAALAAGYGLLLLVCAGAVDPMLP